MKKCALLLLVFSISICKAEWQWSKSMGSIADDFGGIEVYDNSIYLIGQVKNWFYIDSDTLRPQGFNDMFIAKYDISGSQRQWLKQFGGWNSQTNIERIVQILFDDNGFYIMGLYHSYPGNVFYIDSVSATGKSGGNIFLARFNNGGNCQWIKVFGSDGDDEPFSLAKDDNGDLFLLYQTPLTDTIANQPYGPGITLVKTDSLGNFISLFNRCIQNARPLSLSIYNNNIYMAGYGWGPEIIVFDDTLSSSLPGTSSFLVKSNTAGHAYWSKRFGGGTSLEFAYSTSVDFEDNVYLTGQFGGFISIDNIIDSCQSLADMYLIKFNDLGICQWIRKSSATGNAFCTGICIEDTIINIAGTFSGTAQFGPSTVSTSNQTDFFVASYTLNGNCLGINHFGPASSGNVVNSTAGLLTSGGFINSVQIGNTTHQSRGDNDIFVAMMDKITLVVDPARRQGLMIYANPSSGTFNIELPDGFDLTNAFLTVHDITGKEISKFPLNPDSEMRFEVLGATKGEYIVRLTNPQGMVSGKLIVQ